MIPSDVPDREPFSNLDWPRLVPGKRYRIRAHDCCVEVDLEATLVAYHPHEEDDETTVLGFLEFDCGVLERYGVEVWDLA